MVIIKVIIIINLTILECKNWNCNTRDWSFNNNKSNHIGM